MIKARLVPLPPSRMFASGTRVGLEEVAVTTRALRGLSTSFTAKAMGGEIVSSAMVWPAMGERVGGSFTGLTVTVKLVLTEPKFVSVTETVIVAAPDWFGSGVNMTVRLLALPPKTMLLVGSRDGLEEAAARVKSEAGVPESPMVKEIGPTIVSSLTVRFVMLEMVGALLPEGRRLTRNR